MLDPIVIPAGNPGPMTGAGNNTYLLVDDRSAVLVDAGVGMPGHLAALQATLDRRQARLEAVVVTHAHADHVAGAPILAQRYPAAVFWKHPWPEEDAAYEVPWQPLADGSRIRAAGVDLHAVHTPGHAPDHVVLHAPADGILFTGDLLSETGRVAIPLSRGGDLACYLASLERLPRLGARRFLPAHGPAIDDPDKAVRQHLDHRRARERQIMDVLAAGPKTVEAIVDSIYHGLPPALRPAAAENVRAHLVKLRAERRAAVHDGHWTGDA